MWKFFVFLCGIWVTDFHKAVILSKYSKLKMLTKCFIKWTHEKMWKLIIHFHKSWYVFLRWGFLVISYIFFFFGKSVIYTVFNSHNRFLQHIWKFCWITLPRIWWMTTTNDSSMSTPCGNIDKTKSEILKNFHRH